MAKIEIYDGTKTAELLRWMTDHGREVSLGTEMKGPERIKSGRWRCLWVREDGRTLLGEGNTPTVAVHVALQRGGAYLKSREARITLSSNVDVDEQ